MNFTREHVPFEDADTFSLTKAGGESLVGSDQLTFEWFKKPAGHTSPMLNHENEQVGIVLQGELTVITECDAVTPTLNDSRYLERWESHRVVNETTELAVDLDVFAPGRSFDFWMDRE